MSKRKIILIICLLIALLFLLNLGRKVFIISKYSEEYNKYIEITNFYKKTNPEEGIITEFWRKDNNGLLKRTSNEDVKYIYYGEDYNWIIVDSKNSKTAVKMNKEGEGIEVNNLTTGTLYMEKLWDKIKIALTSSISTEEVNNLECYKLKINKEWQMFINKDNFLVMREINGSTDTGIIEYKINEVTDEDVSMPNLDGYTINDTTQKLN